MIPTNKTSDTDELENGEWFQFQDTRTGIGSGPAPAKKFPLRAVAPMCACGVTALLWVMGNRPEAVLYGLASAALMAFIRVKRLSTM